MLLSEKGFKSYDALWSRVRSVGEVGKLNYRGVLVDLHQTPLKTEELVELGRRLRTIRGISFRWDSKTMIKYEPLENICLSQKRMGVLSEVRLFIRQLIRIFDMAEQGISLEEMDNDYEMGRVLSTCNGVESRLKLKLLVHHLDLTQQKNRME